MSRRGNGTGKCFACGAIDSQTLHGSWLCGKCQRRQRRAAIGGRFLPLGDGEAPRCVYPDCLNCPMPDCTMDNIALVDIGVRLIKENPNPCIRCGKALSDYATSYCRSCYQKLRQEDAFEE
jgi:hypothetical protein